MKSREREKKENHAEARNINIWGKINRAFSPLRNLCVFRMFVHKTSKNLFFCKIIAKLSILGSLVYEMLRLRQKNLHTRTKAHSPTFFFSTFRFYPTELLWSYKFFLFIQEFFLEEKHYFAFPSFFTHNVGPLARGSHQVREWKRPLKWAGTLSGFWHQCRVEINQQCLWYFKNTK